MKIKLIYLLVILFCFTECKESRITPKEVHKWDNSLSVEGNIAQNAISLNDSIDFSFLEDIVKDKRVIILGEQYHVDETTTKIKVELLEELKKYGFKTVAFEIAPMLCWYAYNDPNFLNLTKDWRIEYMLFPSYLEHDGCEPLEGMIKNREIKVIGMDTNINSYDFDVVQHIIESYSNIKKFNFNWSRMRQLLYKLSDNNLSEQKEYMSMANDIGIKLTISLKRRELLQI